MSSEGGECHLEGSEGEECYLKGTGVTRKIKTLWLAFAFIFEDTGKKQDAAVSPSEAEGRPFREWSSRRGCSRCEDVCGKPA